MSKSGRDKKLLRKKQDEEEDCTEDWPPVNEALWKPKEDSRCVGNGKVVNWIKRRNSPQFSSRPPVKLNELINGEPSGGIH